MSFNSTDYCSLRDIASQFNIFFKSVFKCASDDVTLCSKLNAPRFIITPTTPAETLTLLKALDPHSSSGFSNIPAQLCFPLCDIFNLSLSRGEYPKLLKYNNVLPIFKKR